jgi:hypothetical protein
VRATTAPTSSTVMNKSIKTDAKPISVTTATSMCYEPKPTHTTPTQGGSVSVLACFKTTKKRNKVCLSSILILLSSASINPNLSSFLQERAIMPRPSTNDSNDTSITNNTSSTTNLNTSAIVHSDIINSNSSPDYHRQSSSTPTRLIQQTSLSSTLSDDNASNIFSLSMQEQINDTTTSSSNSIPISRTDSVQFNNNSNSIQTITTPNTSPIQSLHSTPRPVMEDKSIQCINDEDGDENSTEQDGLNAEQIITNKRAGEDENWTVTADGYLVFSFFSELFIID